MTRDEAQSLIGTRRVMPQTLSAKSKRPIPGTGGTVHECLRVDGSCSVGPNGQAETYGRAWLSGYNVGTSMWTAADDFASWPLAEPGSPTESEIATITQEPTDAKG